MNDLYISRVANGWTVFVDTPIDTKRGLTPEASGLKCHVARTVDELTALVASLVNVPVDTKAITGNPGQTYTCTLCNIQDFPDSGGSEFRAHMASPLHARNTLPYPHLTGSPS